MKCIKIFQKRRKKKHGCERYGNVPEDENKSKFSIEKNILLNTRFNEH